MVRGVAKAGVLPSHQRDFVFRGLLAVGSTENRRVESPGCGCMGLNGHPLVTCVRVVSPWV